METVVHLKYRRIDMFCGYKEVSKHYVGKIKLATVECPISLSTTYFVIVEAYARGADIPFDTKKEADKFVKNVLYPEFIERLTTPISRSELRNYKSNRVKYENYGT